MNAAAQTDELLIPDDVRQRLHSKVQDLNMLPAVAAQAVEIAKDPNCAIGEFASVVERDTKLAADILAMANSVMHAPTSPIVSLHQAIVRLGFRQCRNLIFSSSMASLMQGMSMEEERIREILCRHSFVTAMTELHLNRALNVGFQGEEFTAGLMHDIGRTLLAVCFPDQFAEIDPLDFEESPEILDHERAQIGTDHCELGVWFALFNHLPAALIDTARYHHSPERSHEHVRLVALTAACDHLANHLQHYGSPENYDPSENVAVETLEAHGVHHAVSRFEEIHVAIMESAARDATEMMGQ